MRRGYHKVKPAKAEEPIAAKTSASLATTLKPPPTTERRRSSVLAPTFLSRNSSEVSFSKSVTDDSRSLRDSSQQRSTKLDSSSEIARALTQLDRSESQNVLSNTPSTQSAYSIQSERQDVPSVRASEAEEELLGPMEGLNVDSSQSSTSSSIFSEDSASTFSRESSIYSREASIYSLDEEDPDQQNRKESLDSTSDSRSYQQQVRSSATRRQEAQDVAGRERSALAKKAAMFKNSKLPPGLPTFSASLPTWSMVCRAAQASQDCYDSRVLTRQGLYTPADSANDIKAMIVDDQLIDGSRLVIVAIRGTQFQSLTDWTANADSKPVKPTGFLDNEENGCHSGFLLIAKAMIKQVARQLREHAAASERPALLFTGHSAGGAIAAMLYSHMLSLSVESELTVLTNQFPIIHCITFGAPPLSLTPLPRCDNGSGIFLTLANEGDPVLRLSNAAYLTSLAKLRTAAPPASLAGALAPPAVKVVRGSRGSAVYRQALPAAPPVPWEELPLWPTPPSPLTNAGDIVLLRDKENGRAVASRILADDMDDVIFGDLAEHTMQMYLRRVKELALAAMMGRNL